MRHRWPFQRSAKFICLPDAVMTNPTAVHPDRDEQPTPKKTLTLAPAGLGVRWTLHLVPSHRSTKVTPIFEVVTCVPTPMHEDSPVQVPNCSEPVRALGFGDG
jgi:hypothetical protein